MTIRCLSCRLELAPTVQACPGCGRVRNLPKHLQPLAPVRPVVFLLQRRPGGEWHLLSVDRNRNVGCGTCTASRYGNRCQASSDFERRLKRSRDREVFQLLKAEKKVEAVLKWDERHTPPGETPLSWANDVALFRSYFEFWHGLDWTAPGSGLEFLRLLLTHYKGNHLERIRRVRADLQNKRGLYLPPEEVRAHRRSNEQAYRALFASPSEASS